MRKRSQESFVSQNKLKFPHRSTCVICISNHPRGESVVQRQEILRQFILPLYPERSLDRSKGGNVVQKIINNSNIPPTGDTLCANYLLFWGGILLLNNAVCLSYLFIKFVNHILDMASYNRDKFIPPVTIVLKYVVEKKSVYD